MKIPFSNLSRQYESIREEILDAIDSVFKTGIMLDGIETIKFESKLAHMCNRKHAVTVNSGTQGLIFAQLATKTEKTNWDNVLIPEISYVATLNSTAMANNYTSYCDVDNKGMMDIVNFSKHIDESLSDLGITHVMWVNLYGNMIDYNRLVTVTEMFNTEKITLIEDAAQSFGSKQNGRPSGSFGDISVLSFDPTKNLNNYGSGGCILTNDDKIYQNLRSLRNNGKDGNGEIGGTNSKMSEADCATMLVKLNHFDKWQKRRNDIAEYYIQELKDKVSIFLPNEGVECNWHKFVIRLGNRDEVMACMMTQGIETKVHYDYTLSDFHYRTAQRRFPSVGRTATALSNTVLSLPIYPELSDYEVEQIVISLKSYIP
jgi:dTDP-4-amino-4,6-dideoxygalactose transaminase